MIKKNHITLLIIFVGFVIAILTSINNLNKYDKIIIDNNGRAYHPMIKSDPYRYLSHGYEIKNDLKNGVSYFNTGRESYTKYLPPRIAATYYYLFDLDLFNNFEEKKINIGIHFSYLLIQCFFYFFCLLLLYFSISKIVSSNICFFIIGFLCFEPTIFQYHGTFWSESFFFSFQILLISLILKKNSTNFNFFIVGIFLGILSMQKQMAIFYIIPIVIYFFVSINQSKYKKIIFLFLGFCLIQSFLGYNNYHRSGKFYIMTADTKLDLYRDLVMRVMPKKYGISLNKFKESEGKVAFQLIIDKSFEYNKKKLTSIKYPGVMDYRFALINEKDKVEFDNYIGKRTFNYILSHPQEFGYSILKSSVHTILLNPFNIYSDHNFRKGEVYYHSKTRQKLIPYRIGYTLIIYLICLIGLFSIYKKKQYKILSFLLLSILYFYGLVSWHGNTRYFLPAFIYFSFFFGFGVDKIINFKYQLFVKK